MLIAELLLYKIDSDTASDDRMLMCSAAAAAGLGTAGSSAASSRAASRPATASMGVPGGGSGSGMGSAAGGAAAAAAAGALLGVVAEEEGAAGLRGGSAAAVAAWWATRFRRDLEGAVFDFSLTRWVQLTVTLGGLQQQCGSGLRVGNRLGGGSVCQLQMLAFNERSHHSQNPKPKPVWITSLRNDMY